MENAERLLKSAEEQDQKATEEVKQVTESSTKKEGKSTDETDSEEVDKVRDEATDGMVEDNEEKNQTEPEESGDENAEAKEKDPEHEGGRDPHDDDEEDLDFHNSSKKELLSKIKEASKEDRIKKIDQVIKALKTRFDELYEEEKAEALKKFEADGNDSDAFEYHGYEIDRKFFALYSDLRSKRIKYRLELEQQTDENIKKKQDLLGKLRHIVDDEESDMSISAAKEIQAEWKEIGHIPGAYNKTLWANYYALLNRFYDQRSIYFELKELDRKKNLKVKEEICERAEALAEVKDVKIAIDQLGELHEEYKDSGPVPKEDQEPLWQRFKVASDAVYERRKEYFDRLKAEHEANREKKKELAERMKELADFSSDKIIEWITKTKEIQNLQKEWGSTGGVSRDISKKMNKQFWGGHKAFYNHKNQFFKQLDAHRDENLKKKEELVRLAEELKGSTDWNSTAQKYKHLQVQWEEVGPVPEKDRNKVYRKFQSACNYFFDRKRSQNSGQDKEYQENLNLKLQICDRIEAIAEQDEINLDDIYDLVDNYAQLGFVPHHAIKKAQFRFEKATQKILSLEDLEPVDKADLENHIRISRSKNSLGGDRKSKQKEDSIRRKISELENNIATWNINMEFLASSATADKLKTDLQQQINKAKGKLEALKAQLSALSL